MQLKIGLPIIPIGVFDSVVSVLKVAELLLENGFNCIEITLRTPNALSCIQKVRREFPQMIVGAGSILSKDEYFAAIDAGAHFLVSPHVSRELLELSHTNLEILYIPGFSTPTELSLALQEGASCCKFFPAEYCGGWKYLKAIIEPFMKCEFSVIPTGGIAPAMIKNYLSIPKVLACGMSYIVDSACIQEGNFEEIAKRMKETVATIQGDGAL